MRALPPSIGRDARLDRDWWEASHGGRQTATAVNLCFIVAALLCALGLPRKLADQDDADPNAEPEDARVQVEPSDRLAGDGAVR